MTSQAPKRNHVVCAVDAQMTYALTILLSSLASTASAPFRVSVGYLDNKLPRQDRNFLAQLCEELSIPLDFIALESHPLFIKQGHISPTTFAKFLLADMIPTAHLWLDADTVALAGWDAIFDTIAETTSNEGLVVARRSDNRENPNQTEAKGLRFNAGVLGWPATQRRDWQTPLASMAVVETQEQALFNELYGDDARSVSEAFNTLTYRLEQIPAHEPPFIIHFAGAHKPWQLVRNLAGVCLAYGCPWSAWFQEEAQLEKRLEVTALDATRKTFSRAALHTGAFSWDRDRSGLRLLKLLRLIGPLAPVLVALLRLAAHQAPQGTHPLHPLSTTRGGGA